jgi:hypothetical protein
VEFARVHVEFARVHVEFARVHVEFANLHGRLRIGVREDVPHENRDVLGE